MLEEYSKAVTRNGGGGDEIKIMCPLSLTDARDKANGLSRERTKCSVMVHDIRFLCVNANCKCNPCTG